MYLLRYYVDTRFCPFFFLFEKRDISFCEDFLAWLLYVTKKHKGELKKLYGIKG